MKKNVCLKLCFSLLVLGGIIFAQKFQNPEYPNNKPLKYDKQTTPTIALLNVCLPRKTHDYQRPMITFEENGKKTTRFETEK